MSYSRRQDIMEKIGKLSGLIEALIPLLDNHGARLNVQNARISVIEKRQAWFMGVFTVVGSILSYLFL